MVFVDNFFTPLSSPFSAPSHTDSDSGFSMDFNDLDVGVVPYGVLYDDACCVSAIGVWGVDGNSEGDTEDGDGDKDGNVGTKSLSSDGSSICASCGTKPQSPQTAATSTPITLTEVDDTPIIVIDDDGNQDHHNNAYHHHNDDHPLFFSIPTALST